MLKKGAGASIPLSKEGQEAALSFLKYVNQTGSPYHAVDAAVKLLEAAKFVRINSNKWPTLSRGGKYYITKNYSTIMAFVVGPKFNSQLPHSGFAIAGSHTDSPCFRVRPKPDACAEGCKLLGVETYGGGLWYTWLDRGLGIAGKVVLKDKEHGGLSEHLLRIDRPLVIIPSLAPHLKTAEERASLVLNAETHLRPILCSETMETLATGGGDASPLLRLIKAELPKARDAEVVYVDLSLMDATPARQCGLHNEFIESGRIDNLASVWASVHALIEAAADSVYKEEGTDVIAAIAWDHEEIGSRSWTGADSGTLEQWLTEIAKNIELETSCPSLMNILNRSFLLSVDGAHGVHPNYPEKAQAEHKPFIQGGVVLKENANQRYSSHGLSMAVVRSIAGDSKIQEMVVRNDSPCGSTIGPLSTGLLGVRGCDIGIPQWAMHSCRETCGAEDLASLKNVIRKFFLNLRKVDTRMQCL